MKHKQILRPGDLAQFSTEISQYGPGAPLGQMSIKNFPLLCLQIHERNGWLTTADGSGWESQPTSEGSDVIINAIDTKILLDAYLTLEDHPRAAHPRHRLSTEQRINARKGTTIASFLFSGVEGSHLVILFNDDNLQIL